MAPEQLIGYPADQPCDVFSFGVLIWECITRKPPLRYIRSLKQLTKKRVDPRLHKLPTNCSQNFKALITDCLKAASDRPNFQQVLGQKSSMVNLFHISISLNNPSSQTLVLHLLDFSSDVQFSSQLKLNFGPKVTLKNSDIKNFVMQFCINFCVFSFQVYGWLSAVITAQYASLRPTTFFLHQQEHLFRNKKQKK